MSALLKVYTLFYVPHFCSQKQCKIIATNMVSFIKLWKNFYAWSSFDNIMLNGGC